MRFLLLILAALACTGCCLGTRSPAVMYRDGYGGTVTVLPDRGNFYPYSDPIPYGASMPPVSQQYPQEITSGWYVGCDQQWRPQRWVKLGVDTNNNPSYAAVYP